MPPHATVSDATTATPREKYEGKKVWVYGGGPPVCVTPHSTTEYVGSIEDPVKVLKVERWAEKIPIEVRRGGGTLPPRAVMQPFVFTVQPVKRMRAAMVSHGNMPTAPWQLPFEGKTCQQFLVPFESSVHVERELSLTPPPDEMTGVIARLKAQKTARPDIRGLTHLQLLWLRGVLEVPLADLNTILTAPTWTIYGAPGRGPAGLLNPVQ